MDPDATWALVIDESNDLDERAVAATDLLVWITQGGALPVHDGPYGRNPSLTGPGQVVGNRNHVVNECRHRIFKALDRLAELEDA